MNLLYFLLRSSWGMMITAIVTGFLSGGSSAALIALISRAVSRTDSSPTALLVWGFIGLALVAASTSFLSQMVLIRLSQNAIFELRLHLSRQILASELSHLERLGTPQLLATLTDDVQAVADAVQIIPFLCIDLAIVAGCLVYLFWLYSSVFIIVLAVIAIGLGSCQLLLTRGWKLFAKVREEQDALFKHFRAITEGVKELKLHHSRRHDFLVNELQVTADSYRRNSARSLILFATTGSWGQFLLFFVMGMVLFALPNLLHLSPQMLAGYILTFTYLMLPMDNLIHNLPRLSRASVALNKIKSLGLSLSNQVETIGVLPTVSSNWSCLELKGVTYPYSHAPAEDSFSLGPINLTLRSGELVFIIGGNGSGKSTLAKLIMGLYSPETGSILLDGQPITTENREWYRQHFSAVFADFYLFDRLLGLDASNLDTQAQTYLKQLQLEQKVSIERGTLSTIALSQGQRKRLALLTAYLEDRPIYVFDEWAADQDPMFKDLFYHQFLPELKRRGKTVLAISHDDRYFGQADRVIKLDSGKLAQDKYVANLEPL